MMRSACAPTGLVLVAPLLPGTGSVTPSGGVTETVLGSVPVVFAGTVPLTVNVTWVPAGSVTNASMVPPPAGEPQAAPAPLGVHVHVKLASGAGKASCTRALVTSEGPALLITMVYVSGAPGT